MAHLESGVILKLFNFSRLIVLVLLLYKVLFLDLGVIRETFPNSIYCLNSIILLFEAHYFFLIIQGIFVALQIKI